MKKVRIYIASLMLVAMSAFALLPATIAGASALDAVCQGNETNGVCEENANGENSNTNALVGNIVNTLLFVVGAISVIMIIIGGFMYVTSQGDSGNVTKAKNTILYSIIGLVVAFLAYAIVNWVLKLFPVLTQ